MEKKTYLCDGCNEKFFSKKEFHSHRSTECFVVPSNNKIKVKIKAENGKIRKRERHCKKCGTVFYSCKDFEAHKKTHRVRNVAEEEPVIRYDDSLLTYNCNTCLAEFENQTDADTHLLTHFYHCAKCDEKFKNLRDLFSHQVKHLENGFLECPLCSYQGSSVVKLRNHCNSKHIPTYICKDCGKVCGNQNKLKQHELTHLREKPHICIVCAHGYTTSQFLLNHQIRYHRVTFGNCEIEYQCSICKVKYNTIGLLNLHLKRAHRYQYGVKQPVGDSGKFLCDTCGQGFKTITHLKKHLFAHTEDRPFVCTVCGKAFKHNFALTYHQRIHTGERPYSCQYCGKSFRQHTPFRVHIRTHTGEKPYTCQFCNKGFTTHQGLKLHVRNNNCTQQL